MPESSTHELFLGRQPILDREQRLVAYELLFRNGSRNFAEVTDGVAATATVIANAFTELGISDALGSCRGFINVDLEFLFNDVIELLPAQSVVLEILETVPPTESVVDRCRTLKTAGYTLALDDVIQLAPEYADLLALVDIVKVDIQPLSRVELMQLTMKLAKSGKQLLAEKVDSREQMELCLKLGFSLFQGYYFAKPTIIAGKKLQHSQLALMKLMGLLLSDADTPEIEAALKHEPGLSINLLRMTNSVGAGATERITSLAHAITVLGQRQLLRWIQLLLFASSDAQGISSPLLQMAATRGRFMELLAGKAFPGQGMVADQAFMVGIMSLMPALMGLPMAEIIKPLSLAADVRTALSDGCGLLGNLLRLGESCDCMCSEEELAACLAQVPGVDCGTLNHCLSQALAWAGSISQEAAR